MWIAVMEEIDISGKEDHKVAKKLFDTFDHEWGCLSQVIDGVLYEVEQQFAIVFTTFINAIAFNKGISQTFSYGP